MTQRLRHSWTLSRQRRTQRRLIKAEERLLLLQLELDSQHLRVKELRLLSQGLTHREQETLESREFRLGQLVQFQPPPAPRVLSPEELSSLLGR